MSRRWSLAKRAPTDGGERLGWSDRRRYEQRARSWERWERVWRAEFGPERWAAIQAAIIAGQAAGRGLLTMAQQEGISRHVAASILRQAADREEQWGEPDPSWRAVGRALNECLRRLEEEP